MDAELCGELVCALVGATIDFKGLLIGQPCVDVRLALGSEGSVPDNTRQLTLVMFRGFAKLGNKPSGYVSQCTDFLLCGKQDPCRGLFFCPFSVVNCFCTNYPTQRLSFKGAGYVGELQKDMRSKHPVRKKLRHIASVTESVPTDVPPLFA